ncbi:hypothetical protein F4803DRAFT_567388 [Xylaria telfairii]|nr:hypothetical protein F4803DRAFT_567388 [Xylaria telfairii]
MAPSDQGNSADNAADRKEKNGRTPLKQLAVSRPVAPPATALRRRRKRTGGKRTVRSCTYCRAAHVRCVADRYGVPCERCAKKSWLDEPEQAPTKSEPNIAQSETLDPEALDPKALDLEALDPSSLDIDALKQIASSALALMAEEAKTVSS